MKNEFRDLYMDFLKLDCFEFLICHGETVTVQFLNELQVRKPVLFQDSPMMKEMRRYEAEKAKKGL